MSKQDMRGFYIRIFLPDGSPDMLRIVEKSNWTGLGVVCPRAEFSRAKERSEFSRTGIYLLLGPSDAGEFPSMYVGEADPVRSRLANHFANKDFWTWFVAFVSRDENLNKAHVKYLEYRLLTLAREAKRCSLENNNSPQEPSLSEADKAVMETFLDEMLQIFPVIGVTAFEKPKHISSSSRKLFIREKGIVATGYDEPQGFVVLEGSQAVAKTVPSLQRSLVKMRDELVKQGILTANGDCLVMTQDYVFSSPSTAASVILGRSSNGRTTWKDRKKKTLKAIQMSSRGDG